MRELQDCWEGGELGSLMVRWKSETASDSELGIDEEVEEREQGGLRRRLGIIVEFWFVVLWVLFHQY